MVWIQLESICQLYLLKICNKIKGELAEGLKKCSSYHRQFDGSCVANVASGEIEFDSPGIEGDEQG